MARMANLHSFPVSLPGKTGGKHLFRPGESTMDPWFSRFRGHNQLTEVATDWKPNQLHIPRPNRSRTTRSPALLANEVAVPQRLLRPTSCATSCEAACQSGCEAHCQVACESSKQSCKVFTHYEQIGSFFYCRYCDHLSEIQTDLLKHIATYHADMLRKVKPTVDQKGLAAQPPKSARGPTPIHEPPPMEKPATVPQGSPAPSDPGRPNDDAEEEEGKGFWRKDGDRFFCVKCSEMNTVYRSSMLRHVKRFHDYKEPAVVAVG